MFSTRPESASHVSCSHLLTRRYCILSSLDMPTKGTQVALDSDIEMFIIDNLEGDPRSLLACTLTCKIWHSYATVVLYETVFISSYSAFNALCAHRKQIKNDYVAKYTKCLETHEGVKGTTPLKCNPPPWPPVLSCPQTSGSFRRGFQGARSLSIRTRFRPAHRKVWRSDDARARQMHVLHLP